MGPCYSSVSHLIDFWDALVINYFALVEDDWFLSIRPRKAVYSFSLAHLLASFSCHMVIQTLVAYWRSTFLNKSAHLGSVQFCTVTPEHCSCIPKLCQKGIIQGFFFEKFLNRK